MLSEIKHEIETLSGKDLKDNTDFKSSVRTSISKALRAHADGPALGLTLQVRIATTAWLGRELHTPSFHPDEVDAALEAWETLRVARGHCFLGGKGMLSHYSRPDEADAIWLRVRKAYMAVCSKRGIPVGTTEHRLSSLEAAWAPRRYKEQEKWTQRQEVRTELQKRMDARRKLQEDRREARRRSKLDKDQRLVAKLQARALLKVQDLLRRWKPGSCGNAASRFRLACPRARAAAPRKARQQLRIERPHTVPAMR